MKWGVVQPAVPEVVWIAVVVTGHHPDLMETVHRHRDQREG